MQRPDTESISTLKLWQIEREIENAMLFREGEEDLSEEDELQLSAYIEDLDLAFEDKIQSCASVSENLKGEIEVLTQTRNKLDVRIKALNKNRSWLMGYMKRALELIGMTHAGRIPLRVRIQNNPLSVDVHDIELLPKKFQKVIIEPRKADIIKQIKTTGEVPKGCEPVRQTHLRVY